jgi:hypothetical protein
MYKDRWVECTDEGLRIRGYYFPWGTKHIPYTKVRSVQRVVMSSFRGQWRLWGTSNPRYWASLDPKRGSKKEGLVLDTGRFVHPFITPDDVGAVEACIRAHVDLGPTTGEATRGPVI